MCHAKPILRCRSVETLELKEDVETGPVGLEISNQESFEQDANAFFSCCGLATNFFATMF
jgi:hypothetical protein